MTEAALQVIDVGPLYAGRAGGVKKVAREIGAACRTAGFFYVAGHRVPQPLIDETFAAAARFFGLPAGDKTKLSITRSPHNRGYVGVVEEKLDPSKPADLKQAFNIGLDMSPHHPDVLAGKPFRGVNFWPDDARFKAACLAYFDAAWSLGRDLHRAISVDLGLAENFFEDKLDAPMATLRLLNYPARPASVEAEQLGAGEHTDYGNITLLMTDEVGGLEVKRRNGGWLQAPKIPGAFICNIGDCLMRWTNDVYVSTPHRVVSPQGRERNSIAFFLDPNPDALVACLPTCIGAEGVAKYPPVTGADYLRRRLAATYAPEVAS